VLIAAIAGVPRARMPAGLGEAVLEGWRQRDVLLGPAVRIDDAGAGRVGIARGLDPSGRCCSTMLPTAAAPDHGRRSHREAGRVKLLLDLGNSRLKAALRTPGAGSAAGRRPPRPGSRRRSGWRSAGTGLAGAGALCANVAGPAAGRALAEALRARGCAPVTFLRASPEACGVRCAYAEPARSAPIAGPRCSARVASRTAPAWSWTPARR
jgi:hypothetical protein